jgi:hypothetical protein
MNFEGETNLSEWACQQLSAMFFIKITLPLHPQIPPPPKEANESTTRTPNICEIKKNKNEQACHYIPKSCEGD